jgi:hypothetical protein
VRMQGVNRKNITGASAGASALCQHRTWHEAQLYGASACTTFREVFREVFCLALAGTPLCRHQGEFHGVLGLMLVVFLFVTVGGALAEDPSPQIKPTVGYFSLTSLQRKCSIFREIEELQERAEDQLRGNFQAANAEIVKLQGTNRPRDEIQKAIETKRSLIIAERSALDQLIQTQRENAKERQLLLVFDIDGLFIGGPYVLDHGIDLTEILEKKLQAQEGANK